MMRGRARLQVALLFSGIAIATAMSLTTPKVSAASIAPLSCGADCYYGYWVCDDLKHTATGGTSAQVNEGTHPDTCYTGTCEDKHGPFCGGETFTSNESLETIGKALAAGDIEPVAAAIARHSKYISINTRRNAVQVKNCAGEFIAHLPISSITVAQLSEHVTHIRSAQATE